MVWTGRFELPASGSRSRRSSKLSHVQMVACGKRESDPHPLDGYRALNPACLPFHHFRLRGRQGDQSLLGVPTPATAGTSGGYAPAQEARETVTEPPWCGRRDLHSHAPEGTSF